MSNIRFNRMWLRWSLCYMLGCQMALDINFVKILVAIVLAVCFLQVSANGCTGDGGVEDTCPEGQYCDSGQCYNCSLCSVTTLQRGFVFTKCLCVLESSKICLEVPGSLEAQIIEDPSQLLSDERFAGYEYLNESYDRKGLDCTLPLDEVTTESVTTVTLLSLPKTSSETSTSGGTTKELVTSPSSGEEKDGDNTVFIIVTVVLGVIVVALVVWIFFLHRGKCMIPCLKKAGEARNTDGGGDNPAELRALNRREQNQV